MLLNSTNYDISTDSSVVIEIEEKIRLMFKNNSNISLFGFFLTQKYISTNKRKTFEIQFKKPEKCLL